MSEGRRKAKPVKSRRKKHWALRVLGWFAALFFLGVIGAAGVFFVGYATTPIPDMNSEFKTNTTTVTYAGGQTMGSFYVQNRQSVPLSGIPLHVQAAVIAAEDRTFWTNPGVSPTGMARAALNIAQGEQLQGGSTITQQYVKIMYLTQERTLSRKYKELFISTKLSRSEDKKKILEGYLNTIYFGDGAYGIQAASKVYFNKDVKKLSANEAAFLATILNNPSRFDPRDGEPSRERALQRYRYVLDGMLEAGVIKKVNYDEYYKALPPLHRVKKNDRYNGPQGFLLQMVNEELVKLNFDADQISGGGLKVTTTFDIQRQRDAIQAVANERPKKKDNLYVGLASVRPGTGELVAMYGGSNFLESQLNWARLRARPGSAFKPFAVAAALKDGIDFEQRFQGDSPIKVQGQEYGNEFGEDFGQVNLLQATKKSINTAFYDLIDQQMDDGPAKLAEAAEAAGIPKTKELEMARTENLPGAVLGPDPYASPVDLANAYATFAANGTYVPVHVIKEIRDVNNKVIYQAATDKKLERKEGAIDPEIAKKTSYALQQVVARGGTGEDAKALDRPVAGKTGTAGGVAVEHRAENAKCGGCLDNKDTLTSWWAGYTPQLSTAVLYRAGKTVLPGGKQILGEGDLDPYSNTEAFSGGGWPLKTWLAFMEPAVKDMPTEQFDQPSEEQPEVDPTPTRTPSLTPSTTPTPTPDPTPTPTPEPSSTPEPSTPTPRPTRPHKPDKPTNTPQPPIIIPTTSEPTPTPAPPAE